MTFNLFFSSVECFIFNSLVDATMMYVCYVHACTLEKFIISFKFRAEEPIKAGL